MSKKKITVVSIEDHDIFRAGIELILSQNDDVDLVATSEYLDDIFEIVKTYEPDILLLDLQLKQIGGGTTEEALLHIPKLIKEFPKTKIVVLTANKSEAVIDAAFEAGVSGYVLKDEMARSDLPSIIIRAHRGDRYISPQAATSLSSFKLKMIEVGLKPQHVRHLLIWSENPDATDIELSELLGIHKGTVRNHRSEIYKILHARTTFATAIAAMELGIIKTKTGGNLAELLSRKIEQDNSETDEEADLPFV